jgi:hypothetical protein
VRKNTLSVKNMQASSIFAPRGAPQENRKENLESFLFVSIWWKKQAFEFAASPSSDSFIDFISSAAQHSKHFYDTNSWELEIPKHTALQ